MRKLEGIRKLDLASSSRPSRKNAGSNRASRLPGLGGRMGGIRHRVEPNIHCTKNLATDLFGQLPWKVLDHVVTPSVLRMIREYISFIPRLDRNNPRHNHHAMVHRCHNNHKLVTDGIGGSCSSTLERAT